MTKHSPLLPMICPALVATGFASGQAVAQAPNPPSYSYDTDPSPIAARNAAFAKTKLPTNLLPIPRITCPLYMMEFHIWWRSPYGLDGRPGYGHWDVDDDVDTAARTGGGAYWMRDSRHVGYPMNGLYNSEDEGILRWQLRCLHNSGVDGVFIQMYPEWNKGDTFVGTAIFARILKIAAEEGVKIGIHDEVAFRQGTPGQDPDVVAKRAGDFMKQFGSDPAFLRIDGKPVYAFQYWSRWGNVITDDQLVATMKQVETTCGQPVFWMPFHAPDKSLFSRPEIPGFVANGDSNLIQRKVTTYYPTDGDFSVGKMDERLAGYADAMKAFPNKFLGMWVYPGFNDSPRPRDVQEFNYMPRFGGKGLVEKLRSYMRTNPNFLMLSSWNDWEENTAMEPGLAYDGFDGDPYLYCRILAATKGKTFTPPPLPPKSSVDPWLWQKLYGIDGEPPQVTFSSDAKGKTTVAVSDPDSGVRSAAYATAGDVSADFTGSAPHYVGFSATPSPIPLPIDSGGLTLSPEKPITLSISGASVEPGSTLPVYLGLEYDNRAAGWIEVRFPSIHPLVQYKSNAWDEPKFPVHASIDTPDKPGRAAAVRNLLEFQRDAPTQFVRLTWHPHAKDGSTVVIRRLDLFVGKSLANPLSAPAGEAKKRHSEESWTLPDSAATGIVYVTATDNAGNMSAPVAHLRESIPIK